MEEYESQGSRSRIKSKTNVWRPPLLNILVLILLLVFLFFVDYLARAGSPFRFSGAKRTQALRFRGTIMSTTFPFLRTSPW
jgi:hypothetical protein